MSLVLWYSLLQQVHKRYAYSKHMERNTWFHTVTLDDMIGCCLVTIKKGQSMSVT